MRLALALCLLAIAWPAHAAPTMDVCDRRVASNPDDRLAYDCYWNAASQDKSWFEANRRLQAILALDPERGWALLQLARMQGARGDAGALQTAERALELFEREGSIEGQVHALLMVVRNYSWRRQFDSAVETLDRATRIAESSPDALAPYVRIARAVVHYQRQEYEKAERRLQAVEASTRSAGAPDLRIAWLEAMGNTMWGQARYDVALRHYQEQAMLLRESGNLYDEAVALSNSSLVRVALRGNTGITDEEMLASAERNREIVRVAQQSGNIAIEGTANLMLAQNRWVPIAERRRHVERGEQIALWLQDLDDRLLALRIRAWFEESREAAMELIDEAIAVAEEVEDHQSIARGRLVRAQLAWRFADSTAERDRARALSHETFEAIERLRDLQQSGLIRARTFTAWSHAYYEIAANELSDSVTDESIAAAHAVIERMRARVLLDELDRFGARLDAALWTAKTVSTSTLRSRIPEDTALLSFQIQVVQSLSGTRLGGGWLLVHTREATTHHRVADLDELDRPSELYLGLLRNRQADPTEAGAVLYSMLFAEALNELPDTIEHLVIIPDGPLHRLPLAALADPETREPLGLRYRLSRAPSATFWLRTTSLDEERAAGSLVLADPPTHVERAELGPLPYARGEAKRIGRRLGRGHAVRTGDDASERFLKTTELDRFSLLHFATHAWVDDAQPARSALLLASGDDEDGLLQVPEIVELDLDGSSIVLSACRSATGPVVGAEGVMSLGRSFLVAGAGGIVGSLWPLRDDEAARFFDTFYRSLATGISLGDALAEARAARIAAGDPPAAWAGVVLVGDATRVPFPGGVDRGVPWQLWGVGALLVIGSVALFRWLLRPSAPVRDR